METKRFSSPVITALDYRDAMALWPTGVSVVTAMTNDGRPCGATVNSFASVSLKPPILSVCLGVQSSTGIAVQESGRFAVHVLGVGECAVADQFATSGVDKFAGLDWTRGEGGMPVLREGFVTRFECEVRSLVPVADHVLVLGDVHRISGAPGAPLLRVEHRYVSAVVPTA